jgi:hypothetical protein
MRIGNVCQLAFVLAVGAVSLFGQGNTGTILGTVTDQSGAVVPRAKVTVTNVQTGVATNTETDSVGEYAVRFIPAGQYRIDADLTGFKKLVRENIQLDVFRELRVDLRLETGTQADSVTITAAAALVETETGTLSSTLEQQQLLDLPLSTRDPTQLENFVPGVVQGSGGTVSNGGQVRRDTYMLDGANNTPQVFGGNIVDPNPDIIGEFKVLTNSFSAEYGQTSGAVMIGSTKSGTNEFHGSAFWFFQNNVLNAGNFFTHTRPVVRYNQPGFTVGGPIRKNRTFFFGGYQNTRQLGTTLFTNGNIPQPAFFSGNFSQILGAKVGTDALGNAVMSKEIYNPYTSQNVVVNGQTTVVRMPFSGNIIPQSLLSPAAINITKYWPAPQNGNLSANWNSAADNLSYTKTYDLKIDHNFSDSDKLMGRFNKTWPRAVTPAEFIDTRTGGGVQTVPDYFATIDYVHIFGPRIVNDVHLNYWQQYAKRTAGGSGVVSLASLGINGLPDPTDTTFGMPTFQFTNFDTMGSAASAFLIQLQASRSIVDTASISLSRHTIKFGGEARQIRTDNLQPNTPVGDWIFNNSFTNQIGFSQTGYDFASFMLGLVDQLTYLHFPDEFRTRTTVYALFVQDDWHVNKKLTVNMGLRYDAPLWFHEKQNRSGDFNINTNQWVQFGTDGFRTTPWQNDVLNFGPRLGLAYSPFGNSDTVIRAAYGLFTVGVGQSFRESYMQLSPIFAEGDGGRYTSTNNITWNATLDDVPFTNQGLTGAGYASTEIYPNTNKMAYMQQWNFNIGHQIKNTLVEVGYAGSKGTHLNMGGYEGDYNVNAIPGSLLSTARGQFIAPYVPYPQFPVGVDVETWIGSSSYNSLQAKVQRRFSNGFGILGAFTWMKTIDVGDTGYRDPAGNRNLDRGLSANSIPTRLTAAWTYALPFGKGRPWLTSGPLIYPLGGWEVNGTLTLQAGAPLNPTENYNSEVAGQEVFNAPNVTGNPILPKSQQTLSEYFNTADFSIPALYTMGNAGKGIVFGPPMRLMNLTLGKRFYPFGSDARRNIEFRAEMYNVSNTPTFGNPNVTADSSTFGHITSASNSRTMQLALKAYF